MNSAGPSSVPKYGKGPEPTTPTSRPSWLRDWKGFSDFSLGGIDFRGLVNHTDEENARPEGSDATDAKKAVQPQHSSSTSFQKKLSMVKALESVFRKKGVKGVKGSGFKTPSTLLGMPMELRLIIVEHLDILDRLMLKFACRELYNTIPLGGQYPFRQHSCVKARMFMRLINSDLLPDFYQNDRLLNRPEIKYVLRNAPDLFLRCELCKCYWFPPSVIQCPFHYQMNTEPPLSFGKLIRYRADNYTLMQHMSISRVVTQEEYVDFVERASAAAPITNLRIFEFGFAKSWTETITMWEESGLYEGEEGKRQIWTLHCCNHCKFVLPSNSYGAKCNKCPCDMCGWTAIKILRVEGKRDGAPRFVPLGHLREGTRMKTLREIRGQKLVDMGPSSQYIF